MIVCDATGRGGSGSDGGGGGGAGGGDGDSFGWSKGGSGDDGEGELNQCPSIWVLTDAWSVTMRLCVWRGLGLGCLFWGGRARILLARDIAVAIDRILPFTRWIRSWPRGDITPVIKRPACFPPLGLPWPCGSVATGHLHACLPPSAD